MSATLGWSEESPGASNLLTAAMLPALLVALMLGAAWIINAHPQEPVWDQGALLESRLSGPVVPAPATGFTSQLIVALAKMALPDAPTTLDTGVRLIAMVLYLGAAAWLASRLLERRASIAVLLLMVVTSQYPFMWLSSELFTGAMLMFAIAAWSSGAPLVVTGALLALFGLCKPDVILVALVLLAWWAARAPSRREAVTLTAAFGATLVALLLPGTLFGGLDYFNVYGGSGGRSFASFSQHYAALAARFQIGAVVPNPWSETSAYMVRHFPGAEGLSDVLLDHFPRYVEFVALSCVRGLFRAAYVTNYAALVIPILVFAGYRARIAPSDRAKTLLLSFVGLLPFVLLSYPHVRYLARYYPIFMLLVLMALERLASSENPVARPALVVSAACLVLSLVENSLRFAAGLAQLPETAIYWFPD